MVIITKVFVINENVYHSLILLVWGYLLICNMQELSLYKKNGVYVPFSVRLHKLSYAYFSIFGLFIHTLLYVGG